MNAARRKTIANLSKDLTAMQEELETLMGRLEDVMTAIESVKDEEQEAYDNMPEGLQQGERGQASDAAIQQLEDAEQALDSFCEDFSYVQDAIDALDGVE